MTAVRRRMLNTVARSLRAVRRSLFPGFETRNSRLALAYHGWMRSAARLDYLDDVLGHRMYLDDRDSLMLSVARVIEPQLTRLVQDEVKAGQIVVDIGANIGYYTLLLARQVGPTGRVYSFEPDPTNFGLLRKNVGLNGYANVTATQRAVWHSTGPLRLFLSEENRGDHRVYDGDGRRSVRIDAVRVDDALAELKGGVSLIKMDVQGAEAHALRGMAGLIMRSPDVALLTEFWPVALARAGSSAAGYLDDLERLGFALFRVDESMDGVRPVTREELLSTFTPENEGSVDLVCRRGDKAPAR